MAESERRRNYRYNRVLIETARILDPQFNDAVVFLTGAQIELLRNVTQYLNRLETYVTEYAEGYYLAPTAEDYDDLLAIVANLEEKLMGNENVIFGYHDTYFQRLYDTDAPAGLYERYGTAVPAGEVWRVESLVAYNQDSVCSAIEFRALLGTTEMQLAIQESPAVDERAYWNGMLTLKEDDKIIVAWYGCTLNDHVEGKVRGYKMQVPE